MQVATTHIGRTVRKLLDQIIANKGVFNGINLWIEKETPEKWGEDYAIFHIKDIDNSLSGLEPSDYYHPDKSEFWDDFERMFRNAFRDDPSIIVKNYRAIREFEFYRQ